MMVNSKIQAAEENLIHVYNRFPIALDHGEGMYLYDTEGKEYLDFAAGFAVSGLGYDNKELNQALGKETIDTYNTSNTRGNSPSYGLNYQKTGKELMSQDEIAVMDGAKCILQLRGVRPFLSNKYDITKHPKYRQLSDYNKRNAFDIEKYRQHKLVVKPDDTFDLYDMGEVEAD